jgi:hypothetical protein
MDIGDLEDPHCLAVEIEGGLERLMGSFLNDWREVPAADREGVIEDAIKLGSFVFVEREFGDGDDEVGEMVIRLATPDELLATAKTATNWLDFIMGQYAERVGG